MNININETAPSHSVQFIKHLEENLENSTEDVTVETVKYTDINKLPGEDIPMRYEYEYSDWGVRVNISPANHDLQMQVHNLAEGFYTNQLINSDHKDEDIIFVFRNEHK